MKIALIEPQRLALSDRFRTGLALVTLCLTQLVVVLNFQGASIALPEIQRVFGLSTVSSQWLVNANALAFGGLLLVAGRAADLFGHRRLFSLGLALFAASSFAVGFAPSAGWLIVARAIQGAGTALFVPACLALLAASFPEGPARHRALGVWGAAGPVGGLAAILAGGALAEVVGWRAIFLLAVPFALVALVLTPIAFPRETDRVPGGLDLRSTIAGIAGLSLLLYGLGEASRAGLTAVTTVGTLIAGIALLAGFFVVERRTATRLVPAALIGRGRLRLAMAVAFLNGAATNTPIVFFALYLQQVRGASLWETGLGFLPCNLALIAGSAVGGRVVSTWGFARTMATGMTAVVVGLIALTTISVDGSYLQTLLPGLIIIGCGLGVAQVAIVGAAAAASPAEQGAAAGLGTTSAQVGTAVGLALLVALAGRSGGADPQQLVAGYRAAFFGAAGFAGLAVAVALVSSWRRRKRSEKTPAILENRRDDCE